MTAEMRRTRIAATAGLFTMLFVIALIRTVQLCLVEGKDLGALASRQHQQSVALLPHRGPIVDRHGDVLALSVDTTAVFVRPRALDPAQQPAALLARTLDLPTETVARKLASTEPFVFLQRTATREQGHAVAALKLPGVGSEPSLRRWYPRGPVAGHVLGFANIDSFGLLGIEQQYDSLLRGSKDTLKALRDAHGRRMVTDPAAPTTSRPGARVELTLDATLQQVAEDELEAAVVERQAAGGVAIVMDVYTGELLALANSPRFDPNVHTQFTSAQWRNRAIAEVYEPGSTFKAVLAAAAIEAGVVTPDERIFCENGRLIVGKHVVRDHDPYGWLTFTDVIKYSSNICSAKIGERLEAPRWNAAVRAFGFGSVTGVDLPAEEPGLVRTGAKMSRISLVTTSFGQGISVTPLQLVRAFAAIANGGKLMRPYVVRRVVADDGSVLHENRPEVVGQPISEHTAATVAAMLQTVVDGGTGKQARVAGLAVAGKTGTAQKVDPTTRRYSARDRVSSFVGFLPVEAPRFAILVAVDTPRTATYGGIVAAPVFRRIAEYAVDRHGLRIAPAPAPAEPDLPLPGAQFVKLRVGDGPRGMPSFIGLSMREALVQAARAGWKVETLGSGFVVAQDPPPGAQTAPHGKRLELRFGSAAG